VSTFKLEDNAAVSRFSAAEAAAAFGVSCFASSCLTWVQVSGLLEVHVAMVMLVASLTALLLTLVVESRRSVRGRSAQRALIVFLGSAGGFLLGLLLIGLIGLGSGADLFTLPRLTCFLVWSGTLLCVRCGLLWTRDSGQDFGDVAPTSGEIDRLLGRGAVRFRNATIKVFAPSRSKLSIADGEPGGLIDLELHQSTRFDWRMAVAAQEQRRIDVMVRRTSDIVVSLMLVLATLPLMAITALLIKVDSPGPVLYRQERVGIGGRSFTILKFRSMAVDAERGEPVWAARRDNRVTRFGRIIRFARIDELPQLFNVLRGEMSLVGPRPERPHFVARLSEKIPLYDERSLVRPGVTGWAQVNYPYGASVEDARNKLRYDLFYVKHRSLLLDWKILVATVRVVLFGIGAR
jgi:lipopolysaccharide/colanic/teichoic acid biosynthesis glycosyltransferase